jgi:hypothetical protein
MPFLRDPSDRSGQLRWNGDTLANRGRLSAAGFRAVLHLYIVSGAPPGPISLTSAGGQPYGQEIGKRMSWFTGTFGLPPSADLTVVETEEGAPNGYAAPGLIFLFGNR